VTVSKKICLIIFLLGFKIVVAQKTDKVFLSNGDIITGEIKSMKLAILSFDMDGPGVINIKWEKVTAIKSDKIFEILLRNGEVFVSVTDSIFFSKHGTTLNDIIEMVPIKDKFIRRLSGNVDLGFNYTKSSKIIQFNFGSTITYRIPKMEIDLAANSLNTNRAGDSILTKKQDIELSVIKYFSHRLFVGSSLAWQQNTELGLANRFLFSGVMGKALIFDNHNRLLTAGGFSINEEQSLEASSYVSNIEALLLMEYKKFYYSTPKLSIDIDFNIYPGISNWGRIRTELNVTTSIEIFKDFFVGLTFYDNFDNRPPEGALSKNDFGVNFTVGYKFGK
jgi:hypothetical protein